MKLWLNHSLSKATYQCLLAASVLLSTRTFAATYYVSTSGNDTTGDGSFSAPWQTIQKASANVVAGDIVEIRAGIYRETIVPGNSGAVGNPIIYRAYNGEEVTVSGAEMVTNWTHHSGNIYKAPLSWDPNAIFVDGADMIEARWPNKTSLNKLTLDDLGVVDGPGRRAQGDGRTPNLIIQDNQLHGANDYWNGARVWYTGGGGSINWSAQTSTVTDYDSASKTLTITTPFIDFWHRVPASGSLYFITGLLSELDTANEWHYENGYLYLWAPNGVDPSSLNVEAKSERKWAFNLEGKSHIHFEGIDVFAGSANMENAHYNIIDDAHFKYVNTDPEITFVYNRGGYGDHVKVAPWWDSTSNDVGIYLGGSNNTLKNSIAEYSNGDVVTVVGESNTVKNNILREGNINATEAGVISVLGKNHDILANTMYNAGRSVLQFNYVESSRFMYNDMYSSGLLTKDLGVAYCYITDGKGTVIAYNWVHDNANPGFATGIYLDNGSRNFVLHHNVLWNIPSGEAIFYNVPADNMQSYNNTAYYAGGNHAVRFDEPMTNSKTYNNLSDKQYEGNDIQNNVTASLAAAGFVGGSNDGLQFRPTTNSPSVDAGRVITGITDGYVGSAPDAGAYEYGGIDWVAGHTADVSHLPPLATPTEPDEIKINNAEIGIEFNAGWDYFPGYYDYPAYRSAFRADLHIANDQNDYFEYEFEGTYIQWIGATGPDYGMADVYIDDVLVQSDVDSYSSAFSNQVPLFTKVGLAPGSHKIKVVLNGRKNSAASGFNVSLDALHSKKNHVAQSADDIVNSKNDSNNIAQTGLGRTAVFVHDQFSNALSIMTDGIKNGSNSADSWNGRTKSVDYWGIAFTEVYGFNKVNYTTGINVADGGWFASGLKVQTRQNDIWVDVQNLTVSPAYPYARSANGGNTYSFTFDDTWGDAVRIYGTPVQVAGFNFSFTTIGEFEAFYMTDGGPVPSTETFEGESLAVGATTGVSTLIQNYSIFGWSTDSQLFWPTTAIGHTLEVSFNVPAAGNYELKASLTKAADYGNLSFELDGSPLTGVDFNGYNNGVITELHSLGAHTLSAGSHTLKLTVIGKAANSSNYFAGVDFLRIEPQ